MVQSLRHMNMYGQNINLIKILRYVLTQHNFKTVALWFTYCSVRSNLENRQTHINHKIVVKQFLGEYNNKPVVILTSQTPLDQHSSQKPQAYGVFPCSQFFCVVQTVFQSPEHGYLRSFFHSFLALYNTGQIGKTLIKMV